MTTWLDNKTPIYFVVGGLVMGLSFLNVWFWWGGVIGLFITLLGFKALDKISWSFWCGVLAGTIKTSLALVWFWSIYPLDWLGNFNPVLQLVTIGFFWLLTSLVIGVGLGVFGWLFFLIKNNKFYFLIVPFILVFSEILGSLLVCLYSFGPGSSLNANFSFGYLGYSLANHGLFSLSAVGGGVYGLSFIVALIAISFYFLYTKNIFHTHKNKVILLLILVIFSYFLPQSIWTKQSEGLKVSAIQTYFEAVSSLTDLEQTKRERLFKQALVASLQSGSDVIVVPEAAHVMSSFLSEAEVFAFISLYSDKRVVIVDSEQVTDDNGYRLVRSNIYDSETKRVYHTYKNYLVPSGEFVPYVVSSTLNLLGFKNVTQELSEHMVYRQSDYKNDDLTLNNGLGVLFCSESLSPLGTWLVNPDQTKTLIVHPVSHAWFNNPKSLWYQLDLMLKAQVRWNKTPLVQASNLSPLKAYDAFGLSLRPEIIYVNPQVVVGLFEI
ncbi:hypothetical protein KC845_03920 [Candidatus Kaiserbacteria bacterium]|nr:hypothetical protein [Candidatus Kaiserbacteria bacterium]